MDSLIAKADDGHTHGDLVEPKYIDFDSGYSPVTLPTSATEDGWYTIAETVAGRCFGKFFIYDDSWGFHNFIEITAVHAFGVRKMDINMSIGHTDWAITQARMLYQPGDPIYGTAKLQVYLRASESHTLRVYIKAAYKALHTWSYWNLVPPLRENIPSGYSVDTGNECTDITTKRIMSNGLLTRGSITALVHAIGSDERIKENRQVIDQPLNKLIQMSGITYNRNDIEDKERRYSGVIAQEVESVLPEAVTTDTEGMKGVTYGAIVPLLVECIKDLDLELDELLVEVESLEP